MNEPLSAKKCDPSPELNPVFTPGRNSELTVAAHTRLSKQSVEVERTPSVARIAWKVFSASVRCGKDPTPNHVTTVTTVGANGTNAPRSPKVAAYSVLTRATSAAAAPERM